MKYSVIFQPRALRDLAEQYEFVARESPQTAARWFNRFVNAIEGLSTFPERCSVAPESRIAGREIRQLLFGRGTGIRRVLFAIESNSVRILCIRHSARGAATSEDLSDD